jgi:DNA-binding transcriptional regulator PaaX
MFGQDREKHRQFFARAWDKHQQAQILEPLETMVVEVILIHPEYHCYLTAPHLDQDFLPQQGQTNPFLHLGLHLALREQLSIDQPKGIRHLYQASVLKCNNSHELEHRMMDCLAEILWTSQRDGVPPNEQAYIDCLTQSLRQ